MEKLPRLEETHMHFSMSLCRGEYVGKQKRFSLAAADEQ